MLIKMVEIQPSMVVTTLSFWPSDRWQDVVDKTASAETNDKDKPKTYQDWKIEILKTNKE